MTPHTTPIADAMQRAIAAGEAALRVRLLRRGAGDEETLAAASLGLAQLLDEAEALATEAVGRQASARQACSEGEFSAAAALRNEALRLFSAAVGLLDEDGLDVTTPQQAIARVAEIRGRYF